MGFSGLDPSPGHAPFEKELRKYSAQRCTTVPKIVSYSGPGVIVDCKDPYLQEWIFSVNAVNADATADPNTAKPTDTSVNAVGQPKPPAKKTANPGSKPPPSVRVPCSKHWNQRKQTDMDYGIDRGVTNSTPWTCKPGSPCNDTHWAVWGKSKGGKPKSCGGNKGGGAGKGGGGDKGGIGNKWGTGAPYGCGRR